jgi:hypothetical protein
VLYFASRGALGQVGGRTRDICHEEVRLCGEGPYTRRRAKVRYEPGVFDVVDELAEREVASGSEPGDDAAVGAQREWRALVSGAGSRNVKTLPAQTIASNGCSTPIAGRSSSARSATIHVGTGGLVWRSVGVVKSTVAMPRLRLSPRLPHRDIGGGAPLRRVMRGEAFLLAQLSTGGVFAGVRASSPAWVASLARRARTAWRARSR